MAAAATTTSGPAPALYVYYDGIVVDHPLPQATSLKCITFDGDSSRPNLF